MSGKKIVEIEGMNRRATSSEPNRPAPLGGDPQRTREEHAQELALDYVELTTCRILV